MDRTRQSGILESTYGLGWIRTQLPGQLGAMGLNPWLVKKMPVVGRGSSSRLAIYHQGNLPGSTSAVYIFPQTQSGVVVLANAYGLSDVPDWIAQSVIDVLFNHRTPADYVNLTQEAVAAFQSYKSQTKLDLRSLRRPSPRTPDVSGLIGVYWNESHTFSIVIFEDGNQLKLSFQGLAEEEFDLNHLRGDVFCWFSSSRDLARRGRHTFPAGHLMIHFRKSATGQAFGLEWAHNSSREGGELFTKANTANSSGYLGMEWLYVWPFSVWMFTVLSASAPLLVYWLYC